MKNLVITLALLPLTLLGCASSNQKFLPETTAQPEQATSKVIVYRTKSLQGALAKTYIGVEEGYFSKLDQNQYLEFKVDPGVHTFKARAHGSVASKSDIKVMPGETLCLEARPNHEEIEWLVVPFVSALIPSFILEETSCPSSKELTTFTAL